MKTIKGLMAMLFVGVLALPLSAALRGELKQSTAVTIKFGPIVSAADGYTAETALTAHAAHIRISKNGGDFAAKNSATVPAHDENGYWDIALDATDTGTRGILTVGWTDANDVIIVPQEYAVLDPNAWDSKYSTGEIDVYTVRGVNPIDPNGLLKAVVHDYSADANMADSDAAQLMVQSAVIALGWDSSLASALLAEIGYIGVPTDLGSGASLAANLADLKGVTDDANDILHHGTYGLAPLSTDLNAGVTLADDAITAGKFDEATAFPLASADTGATAVARAGADGDTLETLSDQLDTINTNVASVLDDTGTSGVLVASAAKTGYKLASDGLDSVSTTAPTGVPTDFREMMVMVYRRFFRKVTMTSTVLSTYADDGTTELTEQALSDTGSVQTMGAATTP